MSNIRKTKKCCKHPKTSFTRANIRYVNIRKNKSAANIRKPALPWQTCDMPNIQVVKLPKNQKVLQICENQLYYGKHPICQTSEKPKSAANMRKPALLWQTSEKPKSAANIRKQALPGRTSDISNIRKTKKCS